MAEKKIGHDHAKEMFRRGLAELQAAAYFQESNIAQPNYHTLYGERAQTPEATQPKPEAAPDRGPEIERDR